MSRRLGAAAISRTRPRYCPVIEPAAAARSTGAAAATKIEEKLFSDVKADVNRLFTLESSQLQQQDNLAVAQGNIALNLINVYRALGGGWEVAEANGKCGPAAGAPGPPTLPAPAPVSTAGVLGAPVALPEPERAPAFGPASTTMIRQNSTY